ncbi:MAG: hypothetical protein GY899_00300 [Verrucomicrobiaceae bacterium]|nr:hypothetical protein [Verrucomicrobiaceae bacterium]
MGYFTRRRGLSIFVFLVVSALLLGLWRILYHSLHPDANYTGLALFGVILFLALFNARKKIPFLPVWKASVWMQLHIYIGFLSVVLFLVHIRFRMPNGVFEGVLAAVFTIVSLSGVIGILLSRSIPRLLTNSGESLVYERIPALRTLLMSQAEDIVVAAEKEVESSSLTDFYIENLRPYFKKRQSIWRMLSGRSGMRDLVSRLENLQHYLDTRELPALEQLNGLVEQKHNLDFQYSGQRVLKLWLFVHIPFTYSLLVFAIAHGVLALNFTGRI